MTAVLNTEPKAHVLSNDEEAIRAVWISKPLGCPPICAHTLHDPVRWKYYAVGNYFLNGVNPPRHPWL